MPFNCNAINCKGYYSKHVKVSLFRLPSDPLEQARWIKAIPHFNEKKCNIENFRLCSKHWPVDVPMTKVRGGSVRPSEPPRVFDIPKSCSCKMFAWWPKLNAESNPSPQAHCRVPV